ncbi:sigma-70 family RNA polymerase sigma factor [Bacillaceae bacterium W0354]
MVNGRDSSSFARMSNEEVLEWVMNEYGEELKRYIYTYVKNHATTDDLFQDVMITIYKKLHTFQGKSSLKTWVYSITANKCKDYLRSPANRLILWKDQLLNHADHRTPESRALLDEEKVELINSILKLPIKDREVLILYYYREFSVEEISELLGVNQSTIRSRMMRARNKLKQELREVYLYE